jgi:hypothetical protein
VFEQEYLERLELQTAYTREIRQLLLLLLRRFNPQFQSQQVSQPSFFSQRRTRCVWKTEALLWI